MLSLIYDIHPTCLYRTNEMACEVPWGERKGGEIYAMQALTMPGKGTGKIGQETAAIAISRTSREKSLPIEVFPVMCIATAYTRSSLRRKLRVFFMSRLYFIFFILSLRCLLTLMACMVELSSVDNCLRI